MDTNFQVVRQGHRLLKYYSCPADDKDTDSLGKSWLYIAGLYGRLQPDRQFPVSLIL